MEREEVVLISYILLFSWFFLYRIIEVDTEIEEPSTLEVADFVRIQQPSARINPNLMKIKIEEDYNSIEAPRQESNEKSETATGEEVQGSSTVTQVKWKPTMNVERESKFNIILELLSLRATVRSAFVC